MDVADLIAGLGGHQRVSARLGLGKSAVGMWVTRADIPREHHLALWEMALAAGLEWQPPGAAEIRARLADGAPPAQPESTKAEAA